MKNVNNFGCLEEDFFEKLNEQNQIDYLIEKGLFNLKLIAKGNSSNVKDGILEIIINQNDLIAKPNNDLVEEIYNYVISFFDYDILNVKYIFFKDFNEEIYGHDLSYQREIALKEFKKIHNNISVDTITLFEEKVSKSGIAHTQTSSKFKMLFGQQNANKINLVDTTVVNNYLIGNTKFFVKDFLLNKVKVINEVIYFETWLQIIVELNDKFNFEEDLYFTQIRFDKENFKKYNHIFKTLESYQFTNEKIKSFNKDHKAHIESLYEVLTEQKLIFDHKENFMLFLKKEYDLTISKIISYEKFKNYSHDERVQLFCKEWLN